MITETIPKKSKATEDTDIYVGDDSSSLKYDLMKTGMANEEEVEYRPEIEVIENPVVKRMVFKFKKPVRLKFS